MKAPQMKPTQEDSIEQRVTRSAKAAREKQRSSLTR